MLVNRSSTEGQLLKITFLLLGTLLRRKLTKTQFQPGECTNILVIFLYFYTRIYNFDDALNFSSPDEGSGRVEHVDVRKHLGVGLLPPTPWTP